jgi:CTP:molybdopterin cytidylyltransferase MocA
MKPDGIAITPIILAVDANGGFSRAQARFGGRTALQIATDNSAGLGPAVVVTDPITFRSIVELDPRLEGIRDLACVSGRNGQIGSIVEGLKYVPESAAFMIYPVDYPLLKRPLIQHLVEAFQTRLPHQKVVTPVHRGRSGHPVILAPEMRAEIMQAASARDVVYRDPARLRRVDVRTSSIWQDFDNEASYRRRLRQYLKRR